MTNALTCGYVPLATPYPRYIFPSVAHRQCFMYDSRKFMQSYIRTFVRYERLFEYGS